MGENGQTLSIAPDAWCILVFSMSWDDFTPSVRHLSARERTRVKSAYELGFKVHDGQKRKSGEPFFTHPVTVAKILSEWGADTDTLIAALLHDSVEDTPLTIDEVETTFGHGVAILIEGVTKLTAEEVAKRPTLDESTETLRKMFRLMEQDVRIIVIKLADRLHNMQTIASLKPERQQAIAQETLDVYVRVAEQLSMQDLRVQLEDLSLSVTDPGMHSELADLRDENEKLGMKVMDTLKSSLKSSPFSSPSIKFVYEHKTWEMLREQSETSGAPATGVPNVIVAIVCKSVPDCYYMLGTLHQLWQREALSFQDYINSPLLNGYRGLHTTIILEDGMRIRCKIRTEEMHEYTKRGITTMCFDNRAEGSDNYLEWTRRISPLVEDTKERSDEFLKSLQKDILGDSITLHGPPNQTMQLPKDSTALDAAFYFLGRSATALREVRLNGQAVPLKTPLHHGDSVSVDLGGKNAVNHEWLPFARTGFATALIRSALGEQSDATKLEIGRHLFQRLLTEKKQGFLEEFNEKMLLKRIEQTGYPSLQRALMAIGEGHLEATDLYRSLFQPADGKHASSRHACVVSCRFDVGDPAVLATLMGICKQYKDLMRGLDIRVTPGESKGFLSAKFSLTQTEQEELLAKMRDAGAEETTTSFTSRRIQSIIGVITIIGLWGLDPLIAKLIIHEGMPAIVFTFTRAWTVMIFAFCLFGATQRIHKFSRIPLQHPALWASGIALFLVNLLTYQALAITSPSVYNTMNRATAILLLTTSLLARGKAFRLALAWIATLTGFLILFTMPSLSMDALTLCLGALLVFALYSGSSSRFQQTARIYARFQQFFFYTAVISAGCSLMLLPFFPDVMPEPKLIGLTALFSVVFVGIPYILYYHLMPHVRYVFLTRAINASLVVTVIFEGLLFGWQSVAVTAAAGILFILGNFLVSVPAEEAKS